MYLNHGKPKVAMGLLHQPQFIHGILIKLCSKRKKRGFYNFTIIKPWLHFRKDITPCQSSLLFVPYESNIRYLRLFCKISLFKLSVVNFVLLSVKYHIHTCKLNKCKPSFKIFFVSLWNSFGCLLCVFFTQLSFLNYVAQSRSEPNTFNPSAYIHTTTLKPFRKPFCVKL